MSMLVPSLGRSTSEPTPVSPVVAERTSLFDGCASERSCTACTVPYRIFDIRSLARIFVRNSYRIFVASLNAVYAKSHVQVSPHLAEGKF